MDLIDREQLMNYIRSRKINIGKLAHDVIMKQPSIQSQELCNDAISRQAVLEQTYNWSKDEFLRVTNPFDYLRKRINSLPSVKPQEPKTGHWKIIPFSNNYGEYRPKEYMCSECGWEIDLCRGLQQDTGHRLFCEHCGAKMFEPQERSNKE